MGVADPWNNEDDQQWQEDVEMEGEDQAEPGIESGINLASGDNLDGTDEENEQTLNISVELQSQRSRTPWDRDETVEIILFDEHEAATVIKYGVPPYRTLYQKQIGVGKGNIFYPLAGEDEWTMAAWMHQSQLSVSAMDRFISLQYVSKMVIDNVIQLTSV